VMVQYGSLLFMFPLMVQQETDTVMVQYGSVVAIAITPSNSQPNNTNRHSVVTTARASW
jgi:hypothetical protein